MKREEFQEIVRGGSAQAYSEPLTELLEKHPYSHVVRLAYLKSLKELNLVGLEDALNSSAIHIPNRKALYHLMNPALSEEAQEASAKADAEIDSSAIQVEEESENEAKKSVSSELEKQYVTEAVLSSMAIEVEEEAKNITVQEPKPELLDEKPSTFLDFISGESTLKTTNTVQKSNELISRFLSSEKREKVEFFDPERMAKKSLEDKEGIVSDTLARIYMNQGNYEKAIDAYERLILKYPEKSGYFAARIEKVKDLQRTKRK